MTRLSTRSRAGSTIITSERPGSSRRSVAGVIRPATDVDQPCKVTDGLNMEMTMSKKMLTAFLEKMARDEALRREFAQFAAAHGFELGELTDEDLENVAGGTSGGLNTCSTPTSDGPVAIPYPGVKITTTSSSSDTEASPSSGDESGTTGDVLGSSTMDAGTSPDPSRVDTSGRSM